MSRRLVVYTMNLTAVTVMTALALSTAWARAEGLPHAVPPQMLADALDVFAKETGLQILYNPQFTDNVVSHGAGPSGSTRTALRDLLRDTGLTFDFINQRTVTIRPVDVTDHAGIRADGNSDTKASAAQNASTATEKDGPNQQQSRGNSIWNYFRLAQVEQGSSAAVSNSTDPTHDASERVQLQEVIVTAQKREEREQDVPLAMTVLNPETLSENGQSRLVDYFATVPGLSRQSGIGVPGGLFLTIRGLSTGSTENATVATVIDDVPIGSGSAIQFGQLYSPDLDPSDLARIEVLKGPQGTLYGADSLGGLVKYVTMDPSTAGFTGRVEVSGLDVQDGGAGYSVRGAVNVPLSDTLALRASAFSRWDPGYVDNVLFGQSNVNSADVYGGRVAGLWRPSDNVSLKVSALFQQADGNGMPYFNANLSSNGTLQPTLGSLKYTAEPWSNSYETTQQLYSATLNAKFAGLDLVSVTGYSVNKNDSWTDFGNILDFL